MQSNGFDEAKSWWQFGHVWLVISGPALVIVACIITAFFVASSPNEIVTDQVYQQIMEKKRAQGSNMMSGSDSPALQARNHAATGVVPLPR
ncbi:MAG: nitrogen fixation protein FixH [Rhodoferax sp.]|nr:nitrogen fixation protein FixH [Rhodoferax sp.]